MCCEAWQGKSTAHSCISKLLWQTILPISPREIRDKKLCPSWLHSPEQVLLRAAQIRCRNTCTSAACNESALKNKNPQLKHTALSKTTTHTSSISSCELCPLPAAPCVPCQCAVPASESNCPCAQAPSCSCDPAKSLKENPPGTDRWTLHHLQQ